MIHQSGGCCDGSAPMFTRSASTGSDSATFSSARSRCPIRCRRCAWINGDQFQLWKHTRLIRQATVGAGFFSLEAPGRCGSFLLAGLPDDENVLSTLRRLQVRS